MAIILIVVAVVVLAALAALLINYYTNKDDSVEPEPIASVRETGRNKSITVEGEYVCLSKPGRGPHTLECALGLQTDDDTYYQLKISDSDSEELIELPYSVGDRLRVNGTLEEADDNLYIREGIIEVKSAELLKPASSRLPDISGAAS